MYHKKKKTKEQLERHAVLRLQQRYGYGSVNIIRQFTNNIQQKQATLVDSQSHTRKVYLVEYNGHEFLVIYDKTRNTVMTVLPEEAKTTHLYHDEE